MPRKVVSLNGIAMATILAASVVVAVVVVTLTEFGKFGTAQGQVNNITSSLTLEQKDAICNPNNSIIKSQSC
jgi:hypothetical protein